MNIVKNINRKKRNLYDTDHSQRAFVLETSIDAGLVNNLPYYSGNYTVKNVNNDSHILNNDFPFVFSQNNMIDGYFEATNSKNIDLTSPRPKLVKTLTNSVYHMLADDISEIIYALHLYPKSEVILDISNISATLKTTTSWNFFEHFVRVLEMKKVKYKIVELKKFDIVYINNLRLVEFPFESGMKFDILFEFFKEFVSDKTLKPRKSVFLSRKMIDRGGHVTSEPLSIKNDDRINDHVLLEELFMSYGFDVICPEDFKSFAEQVDFFYDVDTIVSLTSSGLINASFMQPGTTIVELTTPLLVNCPQITDEFLEINGYYKDLFNSKKFALEIHNFYKNISVMRGQKYLSIPNTDLSVESIKQTIETDPYLKHFFNRKNSND